MSDTYYGAPNDFRSYVMHTHHINGEKDKKALASILSLYNLSDLNSYIEHRMSDHRDEPSIHKAHKDASSKNKYDQKQAAASNAAEQRNLRSQFHSVSARFMTALGNPRTSSAMQPIKLLFKRCQEIFTNARNEDRWLTLTEQQTVKNFIEKFNAAMDAVTNPSTNSSSRRWS